MTKHRFISSAIMILLIIFALLSKWFFIAVLLGLTVGGLYEFFYLIKKKGIPIYSYTGILIGILIVLSTFFRFQPTKGWELLFIVLILLMIFFLQFTRNDNTNAIVGISTTLFGILYVSWFLSFIVRVRFFLPEIDGAGVKLLAFILLVTKCGDMGALVVGSKYGKTPLLKKVSPNKTIEGSLGSCGASILAAILGYGLIPSELNISIGHVALMGAFFGAIGQIGDLSESLIKRDCNVKDSGKMLPGLGGVLDAIDSVLFSVPAFYFYMSPIVEAARNAM